VSFLLNIKEIRYQWHFAINDNQQKFTNISLLHLHINDLSTKMRKQRE